MAALTIVSAADSRFFPLLQDLVRSIRDKPQGRGVPIHVLDAGLGPAERAWLEQQRAAVVALPWPHAVEVPGPQRALALRCRIPALIPGHAVYLWMDSDTWVQDWSAVELYRRSAEERGFCIAAETDRSFDLGEIERWNVGTCRRLYGAAMAQRLAGKPLLNAGVFAGRGDAPHWAAWRRWVEQGLLASAADFFLDQTALNLAAYVDGLAMAVLPAHCNWTCHRALPRASKDGRRLLDPQPPYQPLGIVHMTNVTKQWQFVLRAEGGGLVLRALRYGAAAAPAVDPRDPVAAEIDLASAEALTHRPHAAVALLRPLAARHPDHPRVLAALAEIAARTGDLGEAVRAFGRAVALRPGDAVLHAQRGAALLRQGRAEEAAAAFRQAQALQPGAEVKAQLERALQADALPAGDYVSPGLVRVRVDAPVPDPARRPPGTEPVGRDEAHLLFNTALRLAGRQALQVGSALGFAATHLALGGVFLDVVGPRLREPAILAAAMDRLAAAGVAADCRLRPGDGPAEIEALGRDGRRWSLVYLRADQAERDAAQLLGACRPYLEPDCILLLHDAAAPAAATTLEALAGEGWQTRTCHTLPPLGIAWRGAVEPCPHQPDPRLGPVTT